MSFKLGNTNIGELYVGSNKIAQAYLGSNLVYQAETPPGPQFDKVKIGTQTWMAKNLDIDDGGGGITIVDNVSANGVNFGTQYYYTLAAAKRVADTIDGWHLPSQNDFDILANYCGGSNVAGGKLKSTSGWDYNNGTDNYGFNFIPAGYIGRSLGGVGQAGELSTSSNYNANLIYVGSVSRDNNELHTNGMVLTSHHVPVRLIKD